MFETMLLGLVTVLLPQSGPPGPPALTLPGPPLRHTSERVICAIRSVTVDPAIDRGIARPVAVPVDPGMVRPSRCATDPAEPPAPR